MHFNVQQQTKAFISKLWVGILEVFLFSIEGMRVTQSVLNFQSGSGFKVNHLAEVTGRCPEFGHCSKSPFPFFEIVLMALASVKMIIVNVTEDSKQRQKDQLWVWFVAELWV